MAKVEVNMRTCSKHHVVEVTMNDEGNLDVKITTDCPHVREYAEKLKEITLDDVTSFAGSKVVDPDVRATLSVPCLVPNAVFDAAWIEVGMLSKNLCNKAHSNDIVLDGQERSRPPGLHRMPGPRPYGNVRTDGRGYAHPL